VDTGAVPTRIKRPVRATDHSPSSSAVIKDVRSLTSTLRMSSRRWYLIRHKHFYLWLFLVVSQACVRLHHVRLFMTEQRCQEISCQVACSEIFQTQKLWCGDRARHCILLHRVLKTGSVCMKPNFNISVTKLLMWAFISSRHWVTDRSYTGLTSWLSALFPSHTCRFGSRSVPSVPISAATRGLPAIVSSFLCKWI
jgi:hypothetical protein